MIKDEYRVLQAQAYNIIDDELKKVSTVEYFKAIATEKETFKNSNRDNTSNNY